MISRVPLRVRLGLLAVLLAWVQTWVFSQFVVIMPGAVEPASELVRVAGAQLLAGSSNLHYVTVTAKRAGLLDAVWSLADHSVELRPFAGDIAPGLTWDEYADLLDALMGESQEVAAAVAFRHLGYRVTVDGERASLPIPVTMSEGGVGGTSAGLMVALEVYRQLSGDDLAKGLTVAGTGGLRLDGSVEAVDGVRQKVLAAERAHADVFLVPRANADEAASAARRVKILPADTFAQVVEVLQGMAEKE